MDVFCGDAWNIFNWELGCETLPVEHSQAQLWYDYQYWNDEGLFTRTNTTMTTSPNANVNGRGENEMLTSSASGHSILRQKTEVDADVISTPIPIRREYAPELCLHEAKRALRAETAQHQLRAKLTSTNCPSSAGKEESLLRMEQTRTVHKSFGQRPKKAKPNATSQFKGVTKHRATGKFEAHLWDASVLRKGKNRRGRHRGKQIYLGSFSNELAAARTFDMAAICYWGDDAFTNFPLSDYSADIDMLKSTEKERIVKLLRRSEGGYLSGTDRFVGLALFRALHYDDDETTPPDLRPSYAKLHY